MKKIEEQREELAKRYVSLSAPETTRLQMSWDFKNGFDAGVKARDAQWSAVVSELREFKFKSMHFPILTTNDEAADMANRVLNELLTKADQMLKEMGLK